MAFIADLPTPSPPLEGGGPGLVYDEISSGTTRVRSPATIRAIGSEIWTSKKSVPASPYIREIGPFLLERSHPI
jgi:hypothetical protein